MLHSRRQRRSYLQHFIGIAVIVILVVAFVQLVPGVKGLVQSAMVPLWQLGVAANHVSGSIGSVFQSKASLQSRIDELEWELREAELAVFELPLLREENERLSELWQRRTYASSVLGRVLAHPASSPYDTLILDIGTLHDVEVGNIVVVDRVVVGSILEVFRHTSIVQLFSAPGVVRIVTIDESSVPVEARGTGAGNFIAEVPRDVPVSEGSLILFPDVYPRVFAEVEQVHVEASDPFRTVYFRLPINISEIDFVEVVRDGAQPLPEDFDIAEEISGTTTDLHDDLFEE